MFEYPGFCGACEWCASGKDDVEGVGVEVPSVKLFEEGPCERLTDDADRGGSMILDRLPRIGGVKVLCVIRNND